MWIRPETRAMEGLQKKLSFKMIIIWMTLLLVVKSCSEREFLLLDSICCHFCNEGWYRAVNCTWNYGFVVSGGCKLCTECADGMEMIAPCTNFTDIQCKVKESITMTTGSTSVVTPTTSAELVITHTALYLSVTMAFFMIIAAVVYKRCTRRMASGDPAREPFKIMV